MPSAAVALEQAAAEHGGVMDDSSNRQKERAGVTAVFLWLGIGLYVFATTQSASFLSWQSLVYFVGGTLVAALLFGLPAHAIRASIVEFAAPAAHQSGSGDAPTAKLIGLAVMIAQAVVIYLVADWLVADVLFAG